MDTVIARTRPSHFTLSKKIVSPTQTARTTEMARSQTARADMSVSPPSPSTAAIHATIKTLPTVERRALSATELKGGERRRTRRLISAQVRAEPVAQSAPRAASERKGKGAWLFRTQSAFRAPAISRLGPSRVRLIAATRTGYVGAAVGSARLHERAGGAAVAERPASRLRPDHSRSLTGRHAKNYTSIAAEDRGLDRERGA